GATSPTRSSPQPVGRVLTCLLFGFHREIKIKSIRAVTARRPHASMPDGMVTNGPCRARMWLVTGKTQETPHAPIAPRQPVACIRLCAVAVRGVDRKR